MLPTKWTDEVDKVSKDLKLPQEILDRRVEKVWRTGEYVAAGLILFALVLVGVAVFFGAPNESAPAIGLVDSTRQ